MYFLDLGLRGAEAPGGPARDVPVALLGGGAGDSARGPQIATVEARQPLLSLGRPAASGAVRGETAFPHI